MTDARKRIEELEEALKRLVGAGIALLDDESVTSQNVLSLTIRDATSLLSQTETPVEEAGDVERVFINGVWDVLKSDSNDLRKQQKILCLFREAMRPVSVDEGKLAEIRARHEEESERIKLRQDAEFFESGSRTITPAAHADRAFLLSALEGVNNDAD